ncbi:hypothetical protein A9798_15480 [Edwardsiella hoshinae]|uniref:DUF4234 domain-containing protein n=1 Tax=Edwardsiella hoshinae TaxID=93378 RepID=A0ABM6EMG7_9GAMM|nr:DUF4234 domain-containing protein [Edwardsiella hoshinae]AOV98212.1 hypothetical protein A9798_15480 [Edwardsiella hoshinae]
MNDISLLSQRLNTPTLNFVLLSIVTCGIWPLLWIYKKQDSISSTTGMPLYGHGFVIGLAICIGVSHQLAALAPTEMYDTDANGDFLSILCFLFSVAGGAMYVIWAFKAREVLRSYALHHFHFDLKMNAFYTVIFNVFYINYCINDMQNALRKHEVIYNSRPRETHTPATTQTRQHDA